MSLNDHLDIKTTKLEDISVVISSNFVVLISKWSFSDMERSAHNHLDIKTTKLEDISVVIPRVTKNSYFCSWDLKGKNIFRKKFFEF